MGPRSIRSHRSGHRACLVCRPTSRVPEALGFDGIRCRRHGLLLLDLVLHVGRRVSTDTLVDHLWGESPPATATKTVHRNISARRRALGSGVDGWLANAGAGYLVDLPSTLRRVPRPS